MNIEKWVQNRGMTEIPNPEYKKGKNNGQPQYITVRDLGTAPSSPMTQMALYDTRTQYSGDLAETEKYRKVGIPWSPFQQNIDAQLADAQSGWSKMANALGQTIWSEIALGTLRGFTDLADFVSSNILHLTDADYQNPASEAIQQWQDYYNNEVAPIYTNPDVDIQNGGLTDVGWYAKNIPSIASSLTLFIPGAGATKGLSWLTKASVKGMSIAKATGNARRWLSGVRKGQSLEEMSRAAKFVNNPLMIARANEAAKISSQALLMRTMENYQEARDVHQQTYQDALDTLSAMDDETYAEWINNNAGILSEGVDPNNKNAVAKDIAKKAADRTFAMDFSNLIFDVIQLYGLKDFGKGVKAITGRGVANAERQAINAAEELVTGTAPKAIEQGILGKIKEYGVDVAKDFGKSFLEESTEGIEEAVNAIAQKEGVTYGKMLLKGQDDKYQLEGAGKYLSLGLGDVINTWRYLQNPLHEYLASAELQESAFWGVLGGMVFGAGASGMQRADMAYNRYKTKKKLEKQAEKTGESVNAIDKEGENWTSLFELPEQKAAKLAIQNRIIRLKKYQDLFKEIENEKDIFATPNEDGTLPLIEGDKNTKKEKQDLYRARLEKRFISEMAMEAMNSGTFDSLLEYFSNDKVKQAMIEIGMIKKDEADSRIESIKKQLQNVQKLYNDNAAHIFSQASYLNAIGKEDIPLEYLNIIAKNNTDRMLDIEEINSQIETFNQIANELEAKERENDESFNGNIHRTHARLQALTTFYSYLKADEEAIEKDKETLSPFDYERRKQHNKNQQKYVLQELARITSDNLLDTNQTIKPIANVFNAIKHAARHIVTEGTQYDEKTGRYGQYDKTGFIKSDEEVIKELQQLFKDGWLEGEMPNIDNDTIIQQANQLEQQINETVGSGDNSLAKRNYRLYGVYQQIAGEELNKSIIRNRIVKNADDVANEVDYYHNAMNEARKKALEEASDGIIDLYDKYKEKNKDFMQAIIEAYHRNKTEARRLVESIMSKDDAEKFMSYMDIFNFTNTSNNAIFYYLDDLFKKKQSIDDANSHQVNEGDEELNAENAPQSTENQPTDNSSQQPQNAGTTLSEGQIEPQNNQNQQPQATKPRKNTTIQVQIRKDGVVSFSRTRKPNGNTMQAYEYEDGTVEIETKNLPDDTKLRFVRSNLFDIKGLDLMSVNWDITKNPTIIYDEASKKYIIKEQGEIDDVSNVSTPIENNDAQPVSPSSSITTTPTNETAPAQTETTSQSNSNIGLFGNNIVTEEGSAEQSTEAPSISSTGEETETPQVTTGNDALSENDMINLSNNVYNAILSFFPKKEDGSTPDLVNADIDGIADAARQLIYDNVPDKFPKEIVDQAIEQRLQGFKIAQEKIKSMQSPLAGNAVNLAYQSRVEEETGRDFSPIFKATVEAFMEEYNKIVDLPIVDGKQVVRLEDIVRICHQVYDSIDTSTAQTVYNVVKTYLNSEEGSKKYAVLDNDIKSHTIIERLNTSAVQVAIDENSNNLSSYRVNINSLLSRIDSGNEIARNAWNNLTVGDKLLFIYNEHTHSFDIETKNGVNLGYIPIVNVQSDGSFVQTNNSWMTDVNIDAHGNIISKEYDKIFYIFTGSTKEAKDLRETIVKFLLSTREERTNDALLDEFINNPIIADLVDETMRAVFPDPITGQRDPNAHQWFFVDYNSKHIDYNKLLEYLARLYKYDTQISDFGKDNYNDNVKESLEQWYKKLYNTYSVINNIYNFSDSLLNPFEVPITKISEANALRAIEGKVDWVKDYNLLPYSDEGIVRPEEASLGIFNSYNNTIQFSNTNVTSADENITEFIARTDNSLFLSLDSGSKTSNLVHIDGVWTNDISDHNKNGEFGKIIKALGGTISVAIAELVDNPSVEKFNDLYRLLAYSIRSSSVKNDNIIPLLTTKDKGKNIILNLNRNLIRLKLDNDQVDIYLNESGGRYSVSIKTPNYKYDQSKDINGTRLPNVSRLSESSPGIKITSNVISTNSGERTGALINKGQLTEIIRNVVLNFINDNTKVNIDRRGIYSDLTKGRKEGFISYDNKGNLSVNIPGGQVSVDYDGNVIINKDDKNAYSITVESYGQWLIKNGLIKANVGKFQQYSTSKPTNFQPRSENQKDNQRLEIGLPSNGDLEREVQTVANRSHEHVEKNSDKSLFDNLAAIANSDSHNKGLELMRAMVGQSKIDALQKIIDDLQEKGIDFNVFDLLPKELNYDRDLNYYDESGNVKGVIAAAAGEKKGARYSIYNENGELRKHQRRLNTGRRANLVIGSLWLNMASSTDVTRDRRGVAIRKLIHENLHNKLGENPKAKEILLNKLSKIYLKVQTQIAEDILTKPDSPIVKDVEGILAPYRNKKVPQLVKLEEFLVESLTNSSLYNYLNSIESDEKINGEKKSLLNLILDAIIKFFGWTPVRDNTLMAEEVNILKEWTSIINSTTIEQEIIDINKNEVKSETQSIQEENKETSVQESQTEIKRDDEGNIIYDFEEDEDEESTDSRYEESSILDNEITIQPFTETYIRNINSVSESLPIEIQSNFNDIKNNGIISITCK